MRSFGPKQLEFHGVYENRRYMVVVDGKDIFLPKRHFRYLYIMALRRVSSNRQKTGGWVKTKEMDEKQNRFNQNLYELRAEIAKHCSGVWDQPVESSTAPFGKFRLNISPECNVLYDLETLKQFPDFHVQEETFKMIKEDESRDTNAQDPSQTFTDYGHGAPTG